MNALKKLFTYVLCIAFALVMFSSQTACAISGADGYDDDIAAELEKETELEILTTIWNFIDDQADKIYNDEETMRALTVGFTLVNSWQNVIELIPTGNIGRTGMTLTQVKFELGKMGIDYTMQKLGAECKVNLSDDVYLLLTVRTNRIVNISMCLENLHNGTMRPMLLEFAY